MRQNLEVRIDENRGYNIEISDSSFERLNRDIAEFTKGQKRLVIISKKVYKLYFQDLNFDKEELFIMPDGEQEKNYKNYLKIINKAIKLGLSRKDVIIAVGGGVVGDIAGFAASTYMRGIDFIQIPTTLLAAVDSSVGGKTAIDLPEGKNIVGSFYQPKKVFININFLNTLEKRQFLSGMGEILKYSFIENNCGYSSPLYFFEFLTLSYEKIMEKEPITIIRLIEYCLRMKISVVEKDEKEGGLRKVLNFGHTLGHALETITKYKKYTHGEAVAYGMRFVFDWAYNKEYISYSYYRHSIELLEKYGFKPFEKDMYDVDKLINIMKKDKKSDGKNITFIIPNDKKNVAETQLSLSDVERMFVI